MDIKQLEALMQKSRQDDSLKQSFRLQLPKWEWIHGFVIAQFVLQILALIPDLAPFRIVWRIGAFVLSLALLVGLRDAGIKHPAKPWAIAVLCIMAMQLFWHPYYSSVLAAIAQCTMYLAILAPLFWVTRLPLTPDNFRGLVFILWGFHTLSAIVGVLQVYYPELVQLSVSSEILEGIYQGDHLMITLANGERIFRPSGLSDLPGSAANSGFYALLLGTGIALQERNVLLRLAGIISVPVGLFCIYLSQVRSILICALICLTVLALILLQLKKIWQFTAMVGSAALTVVLSLSWALSVGGEMTSDRFSILLSNNLDSVVYDSRGRFLEQLLTELLPEYPLGAGLGRWGMINSYFGNNTNPLKFPIFVEIQWTGWLLDGGVPLILAYAGALFMACYGAWQVIGNRSVKALQIWGAIVLAYNAGAIAITFNNPLFMSQGGMEFWLINTVLFVASHQPQKHAVIARDRL